VSCAKTAEPTEMLFSIWTHVSPSNRVLDGVQIAACKCAIFGRPFVECLATIQQRHRQDRQTGQTTVR